MIRRLLILCVFACIASPALAQEKIIFDTDFGGDADDLGALVMLHNFMDRDECEILAVMVWNSEEYALAGVDAVNRFYDHPNIPLGARKEGIWHDEWQYSKPLADALHSQLTYEDVPTTTIQYRRVLAKLPDSSVTIVTVGPLLNIKRLIESGPDSISSYSGRELIKTKVKEFVIMGGEYPSGEGEWNFNGNMPGVTKFVVENIDVPVTFVGAELGARIKTGKVFNNLEKSHPLYIGFYHFSKHASWMKENFEGEILDNASYDQAAVLYAVRGGIGKYWKKVENGRVAVERNGDNRWVEGAPSGHSYLKLTADPDTLKKLIESIMLDRF